MDSLAVVATVVATIVVIFAIANAVYLHSIRNSLQSTTTTNILFWTSLVIAVLAGGLIAFGIYSMIQKDKQEPAVKKLEGKSQSGDPTVTEETHTIKRGNAAQPGNSGVPVSGQQNPQYPNYYPVQNGQTPASSGQPTSYYPVQNGQTPAPISNVSSTSYDSM